MYKIALTLALVGLLAACSKPAEVTGSSSNPEVSVDTLFTHEGCTVYRFRDHGDAHYYASCADRSRTMQTRAETCGKNCIQYREDGIPTSYYQYQ